MCSVRGNDVHEGILGLLEPGETEDFTHTGLSRIWDNNEPDDGLLYDDAGNLISHWDDPMDN
jgi:micrococcal nuclease